MRRAERVPLRLTERGQFVADLIGYLGLVGAIVLFAWLFGGLA